MTLREVAERAGVSISTVSRVMSGKGAVKDVTRSRVEQAVSQLNAASSDSPFGRSTRQTVIGVVVPDMSNPFFALLVKGILSAARVQGWQVAVYDSSEDPGLESWSLSLLNASDNISSFIWVPTADPREGLSVLRERGAPLVLLDREIEGVSLPAVVADNRKGSYQATTYLSKLGHRRILFVGGPSNLSTARDRYTGYVRSLKDYGLAKLSELVVESDYTEDGAYRIVRDRLRTTRDFTAIVCANDLMALGAMHACQEVGIRVPDEVSIIGYDDIPVARAIGLSTVALPSLEMGHNAIRVLVEQKRAHTTNSSSIKLQPSLVIRSTCKRSA